MSKKKDNNKADAILIASFFFETYKKEEFTDDELRDIIFYSIRDEFTKNIIQYLESFYEGYRKLIMGSNTDKGIKAMQGSELGNNYSSLQKKRYRSYNKGKQWDFFLNYQIRKMSVTKIIDVTNQFQHQMRYVIVEILFLLK